MQKTIFLKTLLVALLQLALTTSCLAVQSTKKALPMETDKKGLTTQVKAVLKTSHGSLTIRFYPHKAPQTVSRITTLIKEKFYDGITFHRVVPNFVVQGGDPSGTGAGGSGQTIPAEFNDIPHVKGTVAMARKQTPNSADSQFYIALSRLQHLDGQYTVFGHVTEGIDIIDKIRKGDKIISFILHKGN